MAYHSHIEAFIMFLHRRRTGTEDEGGSEEKRKRRTIFLCERKGEKPLSRRNRACEREGEGGEKEGVTSVLST